MSKAKLTFQHKEEISEIEVDLNIMAAPGDDDIQEYGLNRNTIIKLDAARQLMFDYTEYVVTAFQNFSKAEVEELTFKFGLNMGGKAGIPFITEGTVGGNLEVEVKCKFPN
ncbi:CU044_2847 family protein [Acaryochloris marina]|uniref:CU044_2847 family protein n=1 Tax=Acaryochloris marina TaxID=155978 RepID=UPI001BAEC4AC|nr:CU044_2847 family protein [Acaryochloris marina]QUY46264.1 hypothetical protein I1H34_31670 [Acaryochloris marina S15]